jgi:hypothetical protein
MNERPIPDAAQRDEDAVEMARIWIAEKQLHCSLKVGMYSESTRIPEEAAWGTILADVAKHVAAALHAGHMGDKQQSLQAIRTAFLEEIDAPTSEADGEFV